MSTVTSKSQHKLALAKDLVDDIELARLSPENLILKVSRLARLVGDEEIERWLSFELAGFVSDDSDSLEWMEATGRLTDREKLLGYWQPFAQIEAQIAANKIQLQQVSVPDVTFAPSSSNPHEFVTGVAGVNVTQATAAVAQVLRHLNELNSVVTRLSGVRSRILALLHSFVTRTYYELEFSSRQESFFDAQRVAIDAKLTSACGDVVKKLPAVYDRLSDETPEAISQALNTCRRILDSFADSLFPPCTETLDVGDATLQLTAQHHQNRINAFVFKNCRSKSRRKRIRQRLDGLYDRISTGVHSEVTAQEARFLFSQSYLLMGEILLLAESNPQSAQAAEASTS